MTLLNISITKAQYKIASSAGIVGCSVLAKEINHHIACLNYISNTTSYKSYPAICKTLINKLNGLKIEAAKIAKAEAEIKAKDDAKKAKAAIEAKAKWEKDLDSVADKAKSQGVPAYFLLLMPEPTPNLI